LTDGAAEPSARAGPGTLTVADERVFGPGGEALARRVLRFGEVRSLALDPARTRATLTYRLANGDPAELVTRLAEAVADRSEELEESALPCWPEGEAVTLYRHAGVITLLEIMSFSNGRLAACHPAIARDPAVARRVENSLRLVPGVIEATATNAKAELRVRFDPRTTAADRLIRLIELELIGPPAAHSASSSGQVDFGLAHASVGVAAAGEFVLPLVTPVSAGMLVLSNLDTFHTATQQAREGKIGLPLLYTSIVGVTLVSGQFLSAALMFWFFRYWEHRYRQDLEVENRTLLAETASLPEEARVITVDGVERLVPRAEIAVGQRVRTLANEVITVDGRVLGGAALVDEMPLRGTSVPVRRVAGDQVLAGSKLIAGALDLEALRPGNETRAARIAQTLIGATMPTSHSWPLIREADDFASRAVAPTFLAAGAAWSSAI